MVDSNICEYFVDRNLLSSSANVSSNKLGPWDHGPVKSLCIDWKFFEFSELKNCLKNQQDADICSKLRQENERKAATRLKQQEELEKTIDQDKPNNTTNSDKSKTEVEKDDTGKTSLDKKQLFLKSKSKSFVSRSSSTSQYYEVGRGSLHSANDVERATTSSSTNNKRPPSSSSLFRTKSSFSIDDIKNLELIEKQIDRHLKELELKKTSSDSDNEVEEEQQQQANDERDTTSSTSRDNNSPSHIALYRIKKLEELQRNVNQSRKRSSKAFISNTSANSTNMQTKSYNRVTCSQTPYDIKFFISTANEDRSSPPYNNNDSKKPSEDLNIKSRPLLNRSASNVNITFEDKPAELTTLAEQLSEIDNIRMQISNEFNQIISIAPLTRVKSVVFRHEEAELNNKPRSPSIVPITTNFQDTTTILQRPKSTNNNDRSRRKTKSVLSFGNSLPNSAATAASNSRVGFAPKRLVSTKGDFVEELSEVNDTADGGGGGGVGEKQSVQLRSESASSINKINPIFKTVRPAPRQNANKKVFDLIRVDGKRYSTPDNTNYDMNSKLLFPRKEATFGVENKRKQANNAEKKSIQLQFKEFSKIKSLIKPAYF